MGGLAAPLIAPNYHIQLAMLWMMIILALTWDIAGGQMGYNSFGNILFFGIGCYVTAVVQRTLYFDIAEYTNVTEKVVGRRRQRCRRWDAFQIETERRHLWRSASAAAVRVSVAGPECGTEFLPFSTE